MGERHRAMTDEELEALLRRQPRRLPSPALWERLAVEVQRGRKRDAWVAWAGAAAVAVVGVVLVVAMSRSGPATDRLPSPVLECAGAAKAADAPFDSAQGGPAGRGRSAKADVPKAAVPAGARVGTSGRTRKHVRARVLRRGSVVVVGAQSASGGCPYRTAANGQEATAEAVPTLSERSERVEMAKAGEDADAPRDSLSEADDGSTSYYLEVSREGAGSAVSGSVTRDAWGRVMEIEIAYDAVRREAPL